MKQFVLFYFSAISIFSFSQNNAPIAVNDTVYYSYADVHTVDTFRLYGQFINNDIDPDGDRIILADILYSGTHTFSPFIVTGNLIWTDYIPPADFSGTVNYQYVIKDNGSPVKYDTGNVTMIVIRKGYEVLHANNIKATVKKDALFSAPGRTSESFQVPSNSGVRSIFASNIWMTGTNNGVIHSNVREFPGQTYQGVHTSNNGPVSNTSHTDSLFNTKWDRVWIMYQSQIDYHLLHWTDNGYIPTKELLEWPGHGTIIYGEAQFLAPYVDVNNDSLYNPYDGDYPIIKGDQAIYFIYNDGNSPRSITPMVTEVHGMAYAYSCQDSAIQNTVFVDYKIYNRSNNTYDSTFIGMWSDMDVGNSRDDYVQCDVMRNMFFMFNGDDFDDANSGWLGYGNYPGAQAVVILKGAKKDPDNTDNTFGVRDDESVNGTGFGDGISDNEYWGLSRFIFYTNSSGSTGDPKKEQDFHNYLRGYWKDGSPLVYGGLGYNNGGTAVKQSRFMFPDSSDVYYYGTGGDTVPNWSESLAGNVPGDRRGVGATGPFTFRPGESVELTYAFVFGRDHVNPGAQAGIIVMTERVDSIQSYYDQGMFSACGFPLSVEESISTENELLIFPNPTKDVVRIQFKKAQSVQVEIIDVSGKVVFRTGGNSEFLILDLSRFTDGLYFVKVSTGTSIWVEKVIKK